RTPLRTTEPVTWPNASGFATQRLKCKCVVFHRRVVLELLDLKNGAAVALQIVHVDLMSRPDALVIPNFRIVSAAHQLILVVVFDLRKGVIVFANPQVGMRVLRDL